MSRRDFPGASLGAAAVALARDYVAPCGGKHLKINLTMRDLEAHSVPNWWTRAG